MLRHCFHNATSGQECLSIKLHVIIIPLDMPSEYAHHDF